MSTKNPAAGKTAAVARAAAADHGLDRIVKAAELIHARPAKGKTLGLAASKVLNLLIGTAGAHGFEDRVYTIPKKDLRRSHKGNERIVDALDELQTTLFEIRTVSPRDRPSTLRGTLLDFTLEEDDDERDDSLLYFRLTEAFRLVHKNSNLWAALSGPTLVRFDSAYALRLYEVGCQMVGRRDPTMRLTVPELRALLQVPAGKYDDWANLRRKTLDAAMAEVNQLAHFAVTAPESQIRRSGRKVISLELRFLAKPDPDAAHAERERGRHRSGRRARRAGAVESVIIPDAYDVEALALLWRKVAAQVAADPLFKGRPIKATLADLDLVAIEGSTAVLRAVSEAVADRVRQHYDQAFRGAFRSATAGAVSEVRVEAR